MLIIFNPEISAEDTEVQGLLSHIATLVGVKAGVKRVIRISEKYRLLGRHRGQVDSLEFVYNGVEFNVLE